jgi:hypothetical protein
MKVLIVLEFDAPDPQSVPAILTAIDPPLLPGFSGAAHVVVEPHASALQAWLEADDPEFEYGWTTSNGGMTVCPTREDAVRQVDAWNTRADRLRAEAKGQASYSSAWLQMRRRAVSPGPWMSSS